MPAAVRQSERRPSAPMTSRAATLVAAVERERSRRLRRLDRAGLVLDPRQARASCPRACIERGDEMPVLDVVAERVEADFGRREADLRRANEPRGRIDDPHDRAAARPVAAHAAQTPSVSSAVTEPDSSAVVR